MAGIYIHIPFCKKLCFYCDFYRVIAVDDTTIFTKALLNEAVMRREYLGNDEVNTIYIGGGTPSVLPVHDQHLIMVSLRENFNVAAAAEISIELNPDDVTSSYLNGLKEAGFNRISLGIQSWRDEDLKFLNRRHDSCRAALALEECLKVFDNVTIDLIYGIPGLTPEGWEMNLEKSFSYGIKHLSAYHLTVENGTVFGKMREKGLLTEVDEETSLHQFNILLKKAEEEGFIQYEISNFGRPSYFSRHNSNYWRQVNYLGLGPSAHSFNGYSRQWNRSDLNGYIMAVKSGLPDFEIEELDSRTRFNEYVMTALRTMWGIDLDYIESSFEKESYDYILSMSSKFRNYGLIKQEKNTLVLTNQGKLISDNIISELMMP